MPWECLICGKTFYNTVDKIRHDIEHDKASGITAENPLQQEVDKLREAIRSLLVAIELEGLDEWTEELTDTYNDAGDALAGRWK